MLIHGASVEICEECDAGRAASPHRIGRDGRPSGIGSGGASRAACHSSSSSCPSSSLKQGGGRINTSGGS